MVEDEDAAARRAARKKARLSVAPPEPAPEFSDLSLDDIRRNKSALNDYETSVSYWRRILQARLDLLDQGRSSDNLEGLADALADAPSQSRRMAMLSVLPPDQVPPLPELAGLWRYEPTGAADLADYIDRLRASERALSEHRRGLHRQIDALQRELIARYRQEPALALTALPSRGDAGGVGG